MDGRPGSGSDVVAVVIEQNDEIVVEGIRVHVIILATVLTHDVKLPITASSEKSNAFWSHRRVQHWLNAASRAPLRCCRFIHPPLMGEPWRTPSTSSSR